MSATAQQVGLLHHTLGLRVDQRNPHRNHFVASEGHHDLPDLEALVASGLMGRSPTPKFCDASDIVFHVTDAGKALAIDLLPPEPKRTRYEEFLRMDGTQSFGDFLTGNATPRFEAEGGFSRGQRRHRMYREVWIDDFGLRRDVQGEWCATKKDAKASYKAALAKFKAAGSAA